MAARLRGGKHSLAGAKVSVLVEEDIGDVMVVVYKRGQTEFRGALLESTTRNVPCGVRIPDTGAPMGKDALESTAATTLLSNGDTDWPAVYNRFSYFHGFDHRTNHNSNMMRAFPKINRGRAAPKPMRLRARKVLCSNCHAICSEGRAIPGNSKVSTSIHEPVFARTRSQVSITSPSGKPINFTSLSRNTTTMPKAKSSSQLLIPEYSQVKSNTVPLNIRISFAGPDGKGSSSIVQIPTRSDSSIFNGTINGPPIDNPGLRNGLSLPNHVLNVDTKENESDFYRKRKKLKKHKLKRRKRDKFDSDHDSDNVVHCNGISTNSASDTENSQPVIDVSSIENKRLTVAVEKIKMHENQTITVSSAQDSLLLSPAKQLDAMLAERLSNNHSVSVGGDMSGDGVPLRSPLNSVMNDSGFVIYADGIVWGKVPGFPWWPGRVIRLNEAIPGSGIQTPTACIAWFGSTTFSSRISCSHLEPFHDNFKLRYNRKKRGPYQKAVKDASSQCMD